MLGVERRNEIMELLLANGKVYVSELAKKFSITEETVRRDLEKLEKQNLLHRSYGGATLSERGSEHTLFSTSNIEHLAEKQSIAAKAEFLIHDGDNIFMDSSTTCLALLPLIKKKTGITIITNSVRVLLNAASSALTVVSTGGILDGERLTLVGPNVCNSIKNYYVDVAIISCNALDLEHGITENCDSDCIIKKYMIKHAKKTILLADHSKFDQSAFVKICNMSDVNTIVTDVEPTYQWKQFADSGHINLIY